MAVKGVKPFRGAVWNGERWEGDPPLRKPREAIRRVSNRMSKKNKEYSLRRKWFLCRLENSVCPVAASGLIPDRFGVKRGHHRCATTIHHAFKRGRYYLDESTWIALSFEGHQFVEMNKQEARDRGWLCDTEETREAWRACHGGLPVR